MNTAIANPGETVIATDAVHQRARARDATAHQPIASDTTAHERVATGHPAPGKAGTSTDAASAAGGTASEMSTTTATMTTAASAMPSHYGGRSLKLVIDVRPTVSALRCFHTSSSGFRSGE